MADPIDVKAPDGSIVRFPAGTSDETINGAMSKEFGGSKSAAPRAVDMSNVDAAGNATGASPVESTAAPEMGYGEQMRRVGGAVDNTVRSLANGIPFMDRIAAAGGAATGVGGKFGDYSGNLETQRGEDKKLEEASPVLNTAGHIVGGALVPLGAASKVVSLAKEVPLGVKTLYGMLTGGTIGGVQGLSGTKDITDLPQAAKDTAKGVIVGAGVGGAIPGASKIVGAGFEKAANLVGGKVDGMSRLASLQLIKGVEADGPAAVRARLAELGPDAMLLDAGPALRGKAQGALLNSDEGRSVMSTGLTARDKATNARIRADVDGSDRNGRDALGPYQSGDPQTVTDAILAHRTAVDGVNYPAALNNAPPVKIAPIMTELIDRIDQAPNKGAEHKALSTLQEMLTKTEKKPLLDAEGIQQYDKLGNERWQDVPRSHDNASVLHKVKVEMDNVIEHDQPGLGVQAGALKGQQAALKQMRFAINDALEKQVPGYAAANDVSAALAKRATAVDLGTKYLGSGKTTPSPDRFAAAFEPLSQGEKIAFAKGSRGEIERVLGTKANDLQALRTELQGEGGWNAAKMATVHGQAPIDALTGSVDRNLAFRDGYNKIVQNSETARATAAAREMKPEPSSEIPLFNPASTIFGTTTTIAKKGAQKVFNALMETDPTRNYGAIARTLTEQGSKRDATLEKIIDALNSRRENAAKIAPAVGNVSAVVAAILGNTALRDGPMRRQQ
jgi:hypothetical protein